MKSGAKVVRGCGCRRNVPKNSKPGEIFEAGIFFLKRLKIIEFIKKYFEILLFKIFAGIIYVCSAGNDSGDFQGVLRCSA